MKIDELKAELEIIRKGCGDGRYEDNCGDEYPDDDGAPFKVYCPTCQAKIEYLKKGISACEETINEYEKYLDDYKQEQRDLIREEILNRQQIKKDSSEGSNTDYLETQSTTEEVNKQECKSGCVDNQSADTPTLIKQEVAKPNCGEIYGTIEITKEQKFFQDVGFKEGYKQALSQRNKEILEIIEKEFKYLQSLGYNKLTEEVYKFKQRIKQQLTTSKEEGEQ